MKQLPPMLTKPWHRWTTTTTRWKTRNTLRTLHNLQIDSIDKTSKKIIWRIWGSIKIYWRRYGIRGSIRMVWISRRSIHQRTVDCHKSVDSKRSRCSCKRSYSKIRRPKCKTGHLFQCRGRIHSLKTTWMDLLGRLVPGSSNQKMPAGNQWVQPLQLMVQGISSVRADRTRCSSPQAWPWTTLWQRSAYPPPVKIQAATRIRPITIRLKSSRVSRRMSKIEWAYRMRR